MRLGLTDDAVNLDNPETMTWAELIEAYLPASPSRTSTWPTRVASYLGLTRRAKKWAA